MKNINSIVDHIYLINLDRRSDRMEEVKKELELYNISFERFSAVDGKELDTIDQSITSKNWNPNLPLPSGAIGLIRTTVAILKDAKNKGYKSILLLEDDVCFNIEANKIIEENIDLLPNDWELFYLGCFHKMPPRALSVSGKISLVRKALCTHAYAISERVYDKYIAELEKEDMPVDWVSSQKIQPNEKSYCITPNIAYQKEYVSDISGQKVNHSYLR